MVRVGVLAAIAALALGGCGTVSPLARQAVSDLPQRIDTLPQGTPSEAPAGFVSFCAHDPGQCEPGEAQPAVLTLEPSAWRLLTDVNESVNTAVRSESDERHYGRPEVWTIAVDGLGDCEDFALTKRKRLIDAGLPEPALRMAAVVTLAGEQHLVLTVATNRGDFVLDNLTNDVLPWNRTGYAWLARQDAGGRLGWVSFNGRKPDVTTLSTQ
jgi:predicted transglutaminase-like cysteine proteinase